MLAVSINTSFGISLLFPELGTGFKSLEGSSLPFSVPPAADGPWGLGGPWPPRFEPAQEPGLGGWWRCRPTSGELRFSPKLRSCAPLKPAGCLPALLLVVAFSIPWMYVKCYLMRFCFKTPELRFISISLNILIIYGSVMVDSIPYNPFKITVNSRQHISKYLINI